MTEKDVNLELVEEEATEEAEETGEEELLFDEGPTLNQVERWKSQFGGIYMTEVSDDQVFIWRTITRKEYKDLLKAKNADALYREERMCEKCVLWPEDYNFLAMSSGAAGIPSLLAEQIMIKSGFQASGDSQKL